MELAKQVNTYGEKCEGLEQYAVQRFAQALHVVPKMLAENTGVKANQVIAELAAAHAEGKNLIFYLYLVFCILNIILTKFFTFYR